MLRRDRVGADERGETLVELIVAVAILGVAAVAVLAGLIVSVKASDQGRKAATGGAYVRSWAEAIQSSVDHDNVLKACPAYKTIFASLQSANPAIAPLTGTCADATDAQGMQKVTLTVAGAGDVAHKAESLVIFLRPPCNAAGSTPCG